MKKRGFTLIEVLISCSLIVVLLTACLGFYWTAHKAAGEIRMLRKQVFGE